MGLNSGEQNYTFYIFQPVTRKTNDKKQKCLFRRACFRKPKETAQFEVSSTRSPKNMQ